MSRSKQTNANRRKKAAKPAKQLTPNQRLQNAVEILDAVRHAAEDFGQATTSARAKTAVRNFLEQARSITWSLEHLKDQAEGESAWNEWNEESRAELRGDPIGQWFYELRNPIVKEGHPVQLNNVFQLQGALKFPPPETPPEGATRWIIDATGTPYWVLADGTKIPSTPVPVKRWYELADIPVELGNRTLSELMQHYIAILERLVAANIARFGTPED